MGVNFSYHILCQVQKQFNMIIQDPDKNVNALASTLYARLLDWVEHYINGNLKLSLRVFGYKNSITLLELPGRLFQQKYFMDNLHTPLFKGKICILNNKCAITCHIYDTFQMIIYILPSLLQFRDIMGICPCSFQDVPFRCKFKRKKK